jgi:phenylalanine-4-hydroxylase
MRPPTASPKVRSESERERGPASEFDGRNVRLVKLERDHPGFNDPVYRARRDQIAGLAASYVAGGDLPSVDYGEAEQSVWREVWRHLDEMHQARACRAYLEAAEAFAFDHDRIPSFAEVNTRLVPRHGFVLAPVAGLVDPASFLIQLSYRRFLATQYMRHGSTPLYTPEPDVVHEYIGHVPPLAHPELSELNFAFGQAALRGDEARVLELIRVYWYTIEFGLLEEDGALKVFGAGILSSFGELERYDRAELRPWDLQAMGRDDFDPTNYQEHLYVAPSYAQLRDDLMRWLDA